MSYLYFLKLHEYGDNNYDIIPLFYSLFTCTHITSRMIEPVRLMPEMARLQVFLSFSSRLVSIKLFITALRTKVAYLSSSPTHDLLSRVRSSEATCHV